MNVLLLTSEDQRAADSEAAGSLRAGSESLRGWFGVDFSIVDADTGARVHVGLDQPGGDWRVRGEICRHLAERGRAELIEDHGLLVALAIPLKRAHKVSHVAVGVFLAARPQCEIELQHVASLLELAPSEAHDWVARQPLWPAEALLRTATLAMERLDVEGRMASSLERLDDLSGQLASTYEEINLLYRISENLKISAKPEDLASLALEWLADVVPAHALAVELLVAGRPERVLKDESHSPQFLTHGACPLDQRQFQQLIERVGSAQSQRPLVANRSVTLADPTRFFGIRELVIVPLAAHDKVYGWLAALDHKNGGEFGSVEASLLSSVAAMLGIHSGNIELFREQAELLSGVVRALTSAIDAKDPYTCGHSDRVARVAVRLAEQLQCGADVQDTVYLSGLLHDVGKIGIDDMVLRKPGKLTPSEYEHIKLHPSLGFKILSDIKKIEDVLPAVLHHHEQWDGGGYPEGLAGEDIPLLARIIAVADAYDAMGSDRPYRKGMPEEKLEAILRSGAGQQWDTTVVDAFFQAREDIRRIACRQQDSPDAEFQELT